MTKHDIRTVFIDEIAKQYKEHNEPIPPWLHIGDIDFDIDKPSGKWIEKEHFVGCSGSAECSVCHERTSVNPHDNGFSLEYIFPKYCPNCGAKMVEEQGENT